MSYETPEDLRYLDTHEWLSIEDGIGTVGITDFAQEELGDIIFFELPEPGATFEPGEEFGTVESIKATSSLYAPVGGTVEAVNEDLETAPELVNQDPYDDGWIIRLAVADEHEADSLRSAAEYLEQI